MVYVSFEGSNLKLETGFRVSSETTISFNEVGPLFYSTETDWREGIISLLLYRCEG